VGNALNGITLAGMIIVASLIGKGNLETALEEVKAAGVEIPNTPTDGQDGNTSRQVKIGEFIINFEEGEVKKEKDLLTELDYVIKYFSAESSELEVLKKSPSANTVCTFADRLFKNEETKGKLRILWDYIDKQNGEETSEIKNILAGLFKIARTSPQKVGNSLAAPADTDTTCGALFNGIYMITSANTVATVQTDTKKLFVEVAKLLKIKIEKGDTEAKMVAEQLVELVFSFTPENNR
jgi:hypothetical protein